MRRFLASTFVLTLFAMAFAGPPIDHELYCVTEVEPETVQQLIGVLSITEGGVRVALVDGAESFGCYVEGGFVKLILEDEPELTVEIEWRNGQPFVTVMDGEDPLDVGVVTVVVPQVAVDGMLNAQRLRAAAMERRQEAQAKREAAREGRVGDIGEGEDDEGDDADLTPGGPPADVPRGAGPGGRP